MTDPIKDVACLYITRLWHSLAFGSSLFGRGYGEGCDLQDHGVRTLFETQASNFKVLHVN